jgi:hypothetical protein
MAPSSSEADLLDVASDARGAVWLAGADGTLITRP